MALATAGNIGTVEPQVYAVVRGGVLAPPLWAHFLSWMAWILESLVSRSAEPGDHISFDIGCHPVGGRELDEDPQLPLPVDNGWGLCPTDY